MTQLRAKNLPPVPGIEEETILKPLQIAREICQEAGEALWKFRLELPDEEAMAASLAGQAEKLYARNEIFREKLRSYQGGAAHLRTCMNGWLMNRLQKTPPTYMSACKATAFFNRQVK